MRRIGTDQSGSIRLIRSIRRLFVLEHEQLLPKETFTMTFTERASFRLALVLFIAVNLIAASTAQQRTAKRTTNVPVDEKLLQGLRYRSIGPARGGRVTALAGHRKQPYTFYMGATGGGVWKTTDA